MGNPKLRLCKQRNFCFPQLRPGNRFPFRGKTNHWIVLFSAQLLGLLTVLQRDAAIDNKLDSRHVARFVAG